MNCLCDTWPACHCGITHGFWKKLTCFGSDPVISSLNYIHYVLSQVNYPSCMRSPYSRFILHVWADISYPWSPLLPVPHCHTFLPRWHSWTHHWRPGTPVQHSVTDGTAPLLQRWQLVLAPHRMQRGPFPLPCHQHGRSVFQSFPGRCTIFPEENRVHWLIQWRNG